MIVEPTPTNPRSRFRRALRLAGIAMPAVLLAGVAGAGLLGPRPEPAAPGVSPAPLEAVAAASPATPSSAAPPASTEPAPTAEARAIEPPVGLSVPALVADLMVQSVPAALDLRGRGPGVSIVAVAGYLRLGAGGACGLEPGVPGSACSREVVIAETAAGSSGGGGFGGFGAHIHASVPPGVLVPGDPGGPVTSPGGSYPFVVVIGRFGASDAGCTPDMRGCRDPFTVERVVWADGVAVPLVPGAQDSLVLDPADPVVADTPRAVRSALGPTTSLLRAILLRDGLEAVDPAAAEAIGDWSAGPQGGSVWYLRVLDVPAGPFQGSFQGVRAPQVRWAVVSQRTRKVLATGLVPGSETPAATAGGGAG